MAASGDLDVDLPGSTLVFQKPHAYQESAHGRETVESSFVLNSDDTVQFRLGSYDRSRELVVDPVFGFSTYLGGSKWDQSAAVTTDSLGNIYVKPLKFVLRDVAARCGSDADRSRIHVRSA